MRIGLIDLAPLDYSPHTPSERPLGGMQSGISYLAMALADRGHDVTLINRTSAPGVYSGVRCLHVDEGFRGDQLRQFDVVVSIYCDGLALRRAGISAPLVLWTGHNGDEPTVQKLSDPAERSAWTRIVLKSEWQKSIFQDRLGLEPWRAGVIGNAISPSVERLSPTRDFYFESDRPPVLLYSSTPFRGLDLLVQAFPAINASVPGSTARIYSSMAVYQKHGENDEYHALYDRCKQLGGFEYYGSVSQPVLAAALSQADILSFPSTYEETSCLTVMEAMASGCIVVCNDLGALRETSAGFGYFAPYPPAAHANLRARLFTSALLKAVADSRRQPVAMRRALEDQMAFARSNYVWSARAEQWERYLLDLLDSQRPGVLSSERKVDDPPSLSFASIQSAAGQEIFVDPQDKRGQRLLESDGNLNPIVLTAWRYLLKEDLWTHVIDVGANYGEMLLNVDLPSEAHIIAIEPNPKIIPYLKKALSHLAQVKLFEVAISDRVGEVDFEINADWSGMSRIVSEGAGHIRVPTLTLDDVLSNLDFPDGGIRLLLKIDVEGHELNVLKGLDVDSAIFSSVTILIEIAHLTESDIDWIFARYDVFGLTLGGCEFEALRRVDVAKLAASGRWDQDVVLRRKPFFAQVGALSLGAMASHGAPKTLGGTADRRRPSYGDRKVAFVTVCKGRLHHIRETLPLIVAQNPEEIVVVDYGCPQNVGDWVEANFDAVKVVRVADDPGFCVSRGRNLGALSASSPLICFIDADVKIAPGFVDWIRANADAHHFYRNGFINKKRDMETYGTFVCHREAFDVVAGFDEVFRGWGGEDDDIFLRLIRAGAVQSEYPSQFVEAISHGDQERVQFHVQKDRYLQNIINLFYIHAKAAAVDFLRVPIKGELDIKVRNIIDENVRSSVGKWVADPSGPPPQVTIQRAFQTGLNDEYALKHDVIIKMELSAHEF
jgi:FkbM family methyltransferase